MVETAEAIPAKKITKGMSSCPTKSQKKEKTKTIAKNEDRSLSNQKNLTKGKSRSTKSTKKYRKKGKMGYSKKNHKRDVFMSPKIPKKFISTKVNDQKIGVHKNLTKWPSPARGRLKSLAKKSHKRASAR